MSLLNENNITFTTVEYLKTPLSKSEILSLSNKLGKEPKDFVRVKEKEFKGNNLQNLMHDKTALAEAMATYPKIMERPIAVYGDRAVIGRPPELVLSII